MEYSKYLASLIKFSKAPKLIYSQNKWLKAISHMKEAEEKNAELVKELEAVKEAGEYIVDIVDGVDVPFNLRVKLTAWDVAVKSANSLINNKEG
jgi:hypothetical protein